MQAQVATDAYQPLLRLATVRWAAAPSARKHASPRAIVSVAVCIIVDRRGAWPMRRALCRLALPVSGAMSHR